MTESRKKTIALFVMREIVSHACKGSEENIRRRAKVDVLFFIPATWEPELISLMKTLMACHEDHMIMTMPDRYRDLAYQWTLAYMAREPFQLDNVFRREIGNQAQRLGISAVQLTEFYRLLLIDAVNQNLRQTTDEASLFRSSE